MGDYAFYVWGSYVLTLIALGGEVVVLLRRRRADRSTTAEDAEVRKQVQP